MANDQTYNQGFGTDGGQITTLSDIQGAGLTLPAQTDQFINIRQSGKIRQLFETGNNSDVLYSLKGPTDLYLTDIASTRFDYKNPTTGQQNRTSLSSRSIQQADGRLIRSFIRSNAGSIFLRKQFILQGQQSFDETKVYNPLSVRFSTDPIRLFGFIRGGRVQRHLDTSNILGAVLSSVGFGRTTSSPPRSSVASEASKPGGFLGLSGATFSSLLGGGDLTNTVMPITGRSNTKGLLRGQTASDAYFNSTYSRIIPNNRGFFGSLLSSVASYFLGSTVLGGFLPPKQPIDATYRADERTYGYYLGSGGLLTPDFKQEEAGGILSGLLKGLGFGSGQSYREFNITQRFHGGGGETSRNRLIISNTRINYRNNFQTTRSDGNTVVKNSIGSVGDTAGIVSGFNTYDDILVFSLNNSNKYQDSIGFKKEDQTEFSDQIRNFRDYIDYSENFRNTHVDTQDLIVSNEILDSYKRSLDNITGIRGEKYDTPSDTAVVRPTYPAQYSEYNTSNVGFDYFKDTKSWRNKSRGVNDSTYIRKLDFEYSTRINRKIRPTNDVDYVNSLGILNDDEFGREYNTSVGKDIIKFYFYDIVNQVYIPFNATLNGFTENNSADWSEVKYVGRADKLFQYGGLSSRNVNFNFKVVCHSVKELSPMWKRINYLVGLTRPSRYSNSYMVPPLIQITLGDFYKNQPCVMTTCNVTVDEDCSWETLSENTSDWSFGINEALKWAESGGKYGQFPMEANISVAVNLLEKERSKVGNGLFGDYSPGFSSDKNSPSTFSDNLYYNNI